MFKVHCVACGCQRNASEENGAQVLVLGFKSGFKLDFVLGFKLMVPATLNGGYIT